MFAVVLYYINRQRMLFSFNHTFLVLIPKKTLPSSLSDYCPISCLGVAYRVIAKITSRHNYNNVGTSDALSQ